MYKHVLGVSAGEALTSSTLTAEAYKDHKMLLLSCTCLLLFFCFRKIGVALETTASIETNVWGSYLVATLLFKLVLCSLSICPAQILFLCSRIE